MCTIHISQLYCRVLGTSCSTTKHHMSRNDKKKAYCMPMTHNVGWPDVPIWPGLSRFQAACPVSRQISLKHWYVPVFNIYYKIVPVFTIIKKIVAVFGGFIDVYHVISCKHAHLTYQKTDKSCISCLNCLSISRCMCEHSRMGARARWTCALFLVLVWVPVWGPGFMVTLT